MLDLDLYEDAMLRDSREVFARIRAAGPVVWLPRHGMYAIGRFDDVRAALRDDAVFASGSGVAANPLANRLSRDTTLASDGATHITRRNVLKRSLAAGALAGIEEQLDEHAGAVVERLACGGEFDAARDFASHLPVTVVAQLVGVRADTQQLLRWGAAAFEALGPFNRRGRRATAAALGMWLFARRLRAADVVPGSWAASVFEARDRGELTTREAKALIIDFVGPSLDTTILASTHLLWLLGSNQEAWAQIRDEPELIAAAIVENVRIASPVRGFTRRLTREHEVGGVALPAGARVALLFGAANLDESRFPEPERFDMRRESSVQLGWGNGAHTCVGLHLSKLEMQALLRAMLPRVRAVRVGRPRRLLNNTLQGIEHLPAWLAPAAA